MRIFLKAALAGILVLGLAVGVMAGTEKLTPEEMTAAQMQATLVPSPGALFNAVDKMGKFNWVDVVSNNKNTTYKNDYLRALNLGTRSADGFLAIQAREPEKLGEIVDTVLTLARELGVDEPILDKASDMRKLASEQKWDKLRTQLDVLKVDAEKYIADLGDESNAILVSTGGWLEGLRAVTQLLSTQYDAKASKVLYQPTLVKYFQDKFKTLDAEALQDPLVKKISDSLDEIASLLNVKQGQVVPQENVEKLYKLSMELVLAIERG